MRPLRITVEGFAAFRERAELELADVDLFALVGPTGAGKSSVIDAMVFALYGAVPRYGSENLVHPVITQGALEARVRLDFTVAGVDHIATRVVRRTKTGATTKEARLERDDGGGSTTVVADDAKAMTAAVTDLVGLDLEQFTKCVVLPQGAFATLLHDTKAKRQDLLVKLLDLGVYERVASAARAEAKAVGFTLETLDDQLRRSEGATDAAVAEAEGHVAAVDDVVRLVQAAAPDFGALDAERRDIDADIAADEDALSRLACVVAPVDVDEVTRRAVEAADAEDRAAAVEEQAAREVAAAEAARAALPVEAELRRALDDHDALAELDAKLAKGERLLAQLVAARPDLDEAVRAAAAGTAAADDRLQHARIRHAAADLARHLHVGDDCPVCGGPVSELPTVEAPELEAAEAALAAARAAERAAADALADHDRKDAGYRSRLDELREQHGAVRARLDGLPSADEVRDQLDAVLAADRALAAARRHDAAAREAVTSARRAAEAATRRVDAARAEFHRVRDQVAALGPPAPGDDLGTDWKSLVAWAEQASDERGARVAEARDRREAIERRRLARCAELADHAERAGITLPADVVDLPALRDACVAGAASARARLQQVVEARDQRDQLVAERDRLDERRQVHDLLAEHLGARGFEAWLLDEALGVLLDGASRWLEQLSSGRYALAVDDKNQFAVIDHANADERRLARTLSGGETFLASLALALALAEQVGELSPAGGRSLEAIFLDEGFGTLDPDTLDVVASAIEELGATGRMVGIVSHVRELAERVPVRFEITKAPGGSSLRRVEH